MMGQTYWKSSNLMGIPLDGVRDVVDAQLGAIKKYGPDIGSLEQAAAHEAGHVVVAHALGESIDGVRLFNTPQGWAGCNKRNSGGNEFRCFTPAENPDLAFLAAVNNLAGFAGEGLVGLDHPSSSIDERMKASAICETLGRIFGQSRELVVGQAAAIAWVLLDRNRQTFDVIRNHLAINRRLTRAEAARMLKNVERFSGSGGAE